MILTRLRFGSFVATLVVALNVAAEPKFWTLTGVRFEDGAVASGYFSYDDATQTLANWNVRVSGGSPPFIPWTFIPANSWMNSTLSRYGSRVYSYLAGQSRDPYAYWRMLDIIPLGALDGSSFTVLIDVSRSREAFESDLTYESAALDAPESRKIIAGSLTLTSSAPASQQVDVNQHGLTGSWHIPGAGGQGIELEVYQDAIAPGVGYLHGSFATHAKTGETGHRWYTFGGTVRTGQTSSTVVIYQNQGGNFNAPPATVTVPVGAMRLMFVDCNIATMEWDFERDVSPFTGWQYLSGEQHLLRLTPNIGCTVDGPRVQDADFSYSGHWFNPAISGQGLFLELNRIAETAFMVWYTYAKDGAAQGVDAQRWYTGQGHFVAGARTLPLNLYETSGGVMFGWDDRFGFVPGSTQAVGTATMAFFDCHAARLVFAFSQGSNAGVSGSINLSRVGPAPQACDR